MPNPKKKHTPMRRDMRRAANFRLGAPNLSQCPKCGAAYLSHHVCINCGYYGDVLVLPPKQEKKKGEGK
ncbi:MAG: 50S ribosomal protein L32 [Elusimicrobia bacterium]|nr:50S ribosomal protein L32 [Candidatus Obscuribacterium magneticum]